jgi:Ca2+-binding EF-hand superfamily protein
MFDTDRNGYVDRNELKASLEELCDEHVISSDDLNRFFSESDKNQDEKIDYREFHQLILTLNPSNY